jgi:Adenylate and Guanylate cyclase catalytic domain
VCADTTTTTLCIHIFFIVIAKVSLAHSFGAAFVAIQFTAYATEIADLSRHKAANMWYSLDALGASLTSAAQATDQVFPHVTMPDFAVHGENSNVLSQVRQVTYAPLIARHGDRRSAWEAYAASSHAAWLEAAVAATTESETQAPKEHGRFLSAASSDRSSNATALDNLTIPRRIHAWTASDGTQPSTTTIDLNQTELLGPWGHAPVWQQAPATPVDDCSIVNLDLLSQPVLARLFHAVLQAQQAVLSPALNLEFLYGKAIVDDFDHPHSILLQPIYSILDPSVAEEKQKEMVGLLAAVVSWDVYFSNILHQGNNGVVLVLHNTCDEHFTYRIDGPNAIFVGNGDLHDARYSDLEIRTPFGPVSQLDEMIAREHCEYDLRIYPSTVLQDRYTSARPIWYALAIVVIFAFTALTFLLFDHTVALRQRKIMAKAKRTHAIVSSLFPSQVRDQLLHDAERAEEPKRKPRFLSSTHHTSDLLGGGIANDSDAMGSQPIAHLYPSATVMVRSWRSTGGTRLHHQTQRLLLSFQFADIVGFTAWSSAREPTQVFTLLETVYQAFDEIANRRRVFKVSGSGAAAATTRARSPHVQLDV